MHRRYLALWPTVVGRVYRLLEMVSEGSPGHGLVRLLSASAAEIGFRWDLVGMCWSRSALPLLSNLPGPVQQEGFRGGPLLDVHGSLQLLDSTHVRERDKALLRSVMVGGVWNGFLLGRVGSVVPRMVMFTIWGKWTFLLLLRFVKILSFMIS